MEVTVGNKESLSGNLLNMFADIFCTEIASGLIDGVHWVILVNDVRNKLTIDRVLQLRRELDAKGYKSNEILEVVKLSNGYLADLDIKECYIVFDKLLKYSKTSEFDNLAKLIPSKPEKVLEHNKLNLAKLCYHTFVKKRKDVLDVCMYNSNDFSKIVLNASTKSGDRVALSYNAFRLTVNDLDDVNRKYLADKKMRISSSEILEILNNSIRIRLTLDRLE